MMMNCWFDMLKPACVIRIESGIFWLCFSRCSTSFIELFDLHTARAERTFFSARTGIRSRKRSATLFHLLFVAQ